MKIVALGDAHLGKTYLSRTVDGGVNQREVDFEVSFRQAVDVALAQQPELIVWLGDIFDYPRPTYRSFRVVLQALLRIREHGVPAVLITGNHDTPRLPGTGSPYTALSEVFGAEVRSAHRMAYERFDFPGLSVHAVPQMLTREATIDGLREADRNRSLDRTNLLLAHPLVPSVPRRYADINEIEVDERDLRADLVLLGHYHTHRQLTPGIWYAGSTDTFTFADDPEEPKGVVVLDTDAGECRLVPLTDQRPLVTLETVKAYGATPDDLQAALLERAAAAPEGAVARVYVEGVDPEAFLLLDRAAIEHASAALDLRIHPVYADAAVPSDPLPDLESMHVQWDSYLSGQDLTGYERNRLRDLGNDYLVRAVDEAT
jgi:DNA repair exonuclease SbcCD nuclease subunit